MHLLLTAQVHKVRRQENTMCFLTITIQSWVNAHVASSFLCTLCLRAVAKIYNEPTNSTMRSLHPDNVRLTSSFWNCTKFSSSRARTSKQTGPRLEFYLTPYIRDKSNKLGATFKTKNLEWEFSHNLTFYTQGQNLDATLIQVLRISSTIRHHLRNEEYTAFAKSS